MKKQNTQLFGSEYVALTKLVNFTKLELQNITLHDNKKTKPPMIEYKEMFRVLFRIEDHIPDFEVKISRSECARILSEPIRVTA
jgi:hypothetical protein